MQGTKLFIHKLHWEPCSCSCCLQQAEDSVTLITLQKGELIHE